MQQENQLPEGMTRGGAATQPAKQLGSLAIGDKIEVPIKPEYQQTFGEKWVWVVTDKDHPGYPAGSVTLSTDQIVWALAFDAKEPKSKVYAICKLGNPRYIKSNISQWLNSTKAENWFFPQTDTDEPPAETLAFANPYDKQPGLLAALNQRAFVAALMETELTTTLAVSEGGGKEKGKAKLFLPSLAELGAETQEDETVLAYYTDRTKLRKTQTDAARATGFTSTYFYTRSIRKGYDESALTTVSGSTWGNSLLSRYESPYRLSGLVVFGNVSAELEISDEPNVDGHYTVLEKTIDRTPEPVEKIIHPHVVAVSVPFNISWLSSGDPDGDPIQFVLERKINNEAWTVEYTGIKQTYQDSIGDICEVQYRVKLIYGQGETAYRYSERFVVDLHPPLQRLDELRIGDQIKVPIKSDYHALFGKEWIWEILDKHYPGYPAESVTIGTEKIVAMAAFDAAEPNHPIPEIQTGGSCDYLTSNLFQWQNSDAATGWWQAQTPTDEPPEEGKVIAKPYDHYPGLLAVFEPDYFTKNLLTTQLTLTRSTAEGGGQTITNAKLFSPSIAEVSKMDDDGVAPIFAYFQPDGSRSKGLTPEMEQQGGVSYFWARSIYRGKEIFMLGNPSQQEFGVPPPNYGRVGVVPVGNLRGDTYVTFYPDENGVYALGVDLSLLAPPGAPGEIRVPTYAIHGQNITISWTPATSSSGDSVYYCLERSVNGEAYTPVYRGIQMQYTEPVEPFQTVRYRVKTRDGYLDSDYCESLVCRLSDGIPKPPATLTIPQTIIEGDRIQITWDKGGNSDDIPFVFVLERQFDSQGYTEIYRGAYMQMMEEISHCQRVRYRVKTVNEQGESAYKYSGATATPVQSGKPTMPSQITVPDVVIIGRPFMVDISPSTSPAPDEIIYQAERRENGGIWQLANSGSEREFADTIEKEAQAQYRVKATNRYGDSAWQTSDTCQAVPANPVISDMDRDLGVITDSLFVPTQQYRVDDPAGEPVTVTERVDGNPLSTFSAVSGASLSFTLSSDTWLEMKNGLHIVEIEVTNLSGYSALRRWTLTKQVNRIAGTTLPSVYAETQRPLEVKVTLTGSMAGCTVKGFVCNNAYDALPTWESVQLDSEHQFLNTMKTAESWGVAVKWEIENMGDTTRYLSGIRLQYRTA